MQTENKHAPNDFTPIMAALDLADYVLLITNNSKYFPTQSKKKTNKKPKTATNNDTKDEPKKENLQKDKSSENTPKEINLFEDDPKEDCPFDGALKKNNSKTKTEMVTEVETITELPSNIFLINMLREQVYKIYRQSYKINRSR